MHSSRLFQSYMCILADYIITRCPVFLSFGDRVTRPSLGAITGMMEAEWKGLIHVHNREDICMRSPLTSVADTPDYGHILFGIAMVTALTVVAGK